jgi:hypothetical protein
MAELVDTADLLFTGKDPTVRQTYESLLTVLAFFGPFTVEAKKPRSTLFGRVGLPGRIRAKAISISICASHAL